MRREEYKLRTRVLGDYSPAPDIPKPALYCRLQQTLAESGFAAKLREICALACTQTKVVGATALAKQPALPGQPLSVRLEASPRDHPSRVAYIDVARALGVLAIVVGHAWYGSLTERITLSFDLPLFFFIAGFVYSERYSAQPHVFLARRFSTLYLPFIRWGLFWLALHNVLLDVGIYSDKTGYLGCCSFRYEWSHFLQATFRILTFRGTEPMAGAFWFLSSLFITNVVFCVISFVLLRLAKRPVESLRLTVVLLVAAAGYFSNPLFRNRLYIGTSLVALLIFYAGLMFRRYQSRIPLRWFLAIPAAVLVIMSGGGVYLGENTYENPWLLVTVVPAGIYACLYVARCLENNRFLQYVGSNSIFIIATHFFAFKAVALIHIHAQGYPNYFLAKHPVISGGHGWWIAYALVGALLPVMAKLLIERLLTFLRAKSEHLPLVRQVRFMW